jgi:putative PEP-CTERM system TPR-repeat lipoprotein
MALAEIRARAGAPLDELRSILTEAIKASPSESEPRLQLIDLALKKRQYKDALAVAQEAAAALPNDVRVLDAVGRAQAEAGNLEQAITTFRKLASIDAKSAAPYIRLADVYKAANKREAAETALRKAVEVEPSNRVAHDNLMELLFAAKRTGDALEFSRNMQQQRPKDPSGYLLEGVVHVRAKDLNAALAVFRKGIAAVGNTVTDLQRMVYVTQIKLGQTAEAERAAQAWLKEHPEDAALEYQMAITAMTRQDLDQAETRLKRVLARRPNNPLALNNMAWVLAVRGKPGGVAYAQKAVDLLPDQAALVDTLAMALAAEKQVPKALETQKRASELAPEDHGIRLNLAKIALQAGDKALARKELERLDALGNDFAHRDEVTKLMKSL